LFKLQKSLASGVQHAEHKALGFNMTMTKHTVPLWRDAAGPAITRGRNKIQEAWHPAYFQGCFQDSRHTDGLDKVCHAKKVQRVNLRDCINPPLGPQRGSESAP